MSRNRRKLFTPEEAANLIIAEEPECNESLDPEEQEAGPSAASPPKLMVTSSEKRYPSARPEHRRAIAVPLNDPDPSFSDNDFDPFADESATDDNEEGNTTATEDAETASNSDEEESNASGENLETPEKTRKRKRKPKNIRL